MKNIKKLLSILLAFTLLLTVFAVPTLEVNAASFGKVSSKVRIYPRSASNGFTFNLADSGDKIKNIKTSSSSLKAKQTQNNVTIDDDGTSTDNYATIGLYASKKGKYTLKFDIVKSNGQKRSSHKVTVYAYDDFAVKYVKANNKYVYGLELLSGNSGKVKVSLNSGYKLKKLEYGVFNKAGSNMIYKKFKNGAKITYGKYFNKYDHEYKSEYSSYYSSYWRRGLMAPTEIKITYIDKYTKQEDVTYITLNKWVG